MLQAPDIFETFYQSCIFATAHFQLDVNATILWSDFTRQHNQFAGNLFDEGPIEFIFILTFINPNAIFIEGIAMVECPFCKRINDADAVQCSCGYFFNKEEYEEKLEKENQQAQEAYEKSTPSSSKFIHFAIKSGYIGGIILIILGVYLMYLGFQVDAVEPYPLGMIAVGIIAIGIKIQDALAMRKLRKNATVEKGTKDFKEYKKFGSQ